MQNPLSNLAVDPAKGIDPANMAVTMPDIIPNHVAQVGVKYEDYRIRYLKVDFDNLDDIFLLEDLETKALHNKGIFILNKEKFTMQAAGKVYILVSYMEATPAAEKAAPPDFLRKQET